MPITKPFALAAVLCAFATTSFAAELDYDTGFFPGAEYPAQAPDPADCLGFPPGRRAARPDEIGRCLEAWAKASPRMHLKNYATSHEGRPLYLVILGTPERIAARDDLQQRLDRLDDPRGLSDSEADSLLAELPAVAWLAHSIHGDETSGADAALALTHHLAFDESAASRELLGKVLVIIDPMMNPDGRHRFLQQVTEYRSERPNVDDQSLVHGGYWPWGRTNHYLFDLNRDWLFGVHPETRGRMREVREWNPQLFVDAHEMGPQDSYLFSPPRDPVNPNLPDWQDRWYERFASDQATAFDQHRWRYYTGEWNEGWYPGYSNSWAAFLGAVGVLYEQAGVANAGIRRASGQVLTYRESVHHQVVSAMANLGTLAANAGEIKRGWLEQRRRSVSDDGPYADRTFAILPTENRGRMEQILALLDLHGIETHRLRETTRVAGFTDQLGRPGRRVELPAGTVLIPNRQPKAHLAAALLEFDPRIPDETLDRERDELLRKGETRIYDVTAWNLTMLYGLEALTLSGEMPGATERVADALGPSDPPAPDPGALGWFFPGADDRSLAAAAHLMQNGVQVRVSREDTRLGGADVAAASPVVLPTDNRGLGDELRERVQSATAATGLSASAIGTGLGHGELADLGGEHFPLLREPRVALLGRGDFSAYDFGAIWHHLDTRLGLDHSHLTESQLADSDLRRYNVMVLPDRRDGEFSKESLEALGAWVRNGGTLIAVAGSAALLADAESGIGGARLLPDVLEYLLPYRASLSREWQAETGARPSSEAVWSHRAPGTLAYPWGGGAEDDEVGPPSGSGPESAEADAKDEEKPATPAQLRDRWQALFMPQGALLAARVDPESWLGLGTATPLPVLAGNVPILMAADPVQAPVRYGVLESAANDSDDESREMGWATLPAGHDLRLRMSGLLWPEAALRLANAAWLTRESVGRGQVILFGSPPVFRGATLATARVLSNAVVLGPGIGTEPVIEP